MYLLSMRFALDFTMFYMFCLTKNYMNMNLLLVMSKLDLQTYFMSLYTWVHIKLSRVKGLCGK